MATQHAKAARDFRYLESLAQLSDQVELDAEREGLMYDPTKERAAQMICGGIALWFAEHGDNYDGEDKVRRLRAYYEAEGWI